jgi:enamine deaminase RidA (YjgF/YER057c/UK114 family)
MLKRLNPATVHAPAGKYSHGVEVPPGARLLYVSGQVGAKPDGSTAPSDAAQCEQAWANLMNVLAAAGMGGADIVKLNAYVTRTDLIPVYRTARDKALGDAVPPASTLVVAAALANPAWVVEIECVAARA